MELSVVVRWRKQLGGLVCTVYIPLLPTLGRARCLAASISRQSAGDRSFLGGWVSPTERARRDGDGEGG